MNKRAKFLLAFIIFAVVGFLGYNYIYHEHRDIATEKPEIITTVELLRKFQQNPTPAILNKTVEISGTITEINQKAITVDNKIHCSFLTEVSSKEVGDSVTIKGRCIGYDDLFELVKLDQCLLQ